MVQVFPQSVRDLTLKQWTVEDYHRMLRAGILSSEDRVELLEGQIVEMVPQNPPQASRIDDGGDYLKVNPNGYVPVLELDNGTLAPGSEPEPDFAIVRPDPNRYRDRHPGPQDILLLIEVADATLTRDRSYKAVIYAKAGIPEYWIIDLPQRQMIVLHDPQGETYQKEQILGADDQRAPLQCPEVTVNLRYLLL